MRPITVEALEFTWEPEIEGFCIATFDCRATADVTLGEPRSWSDPGSGPEIEGFRDIEVEGMKYDYSRPHGDRAVRKWFRPHDTLRDWILAYLETGAVNWDFEQEALDIGTGPDPDYQREMRRDTA